MDPGLVIWEGTWSEGPNRCERGASDGGFQLYFQLYSDSEMRKGFWSETPDGPLSWSRGARRGGLVVEPDNF